MTCTRCGSEATKENYYCNSCSSQFIESGQAWYASESEKRID